MTSFMSNIGAVVLKTVEILLAPARAVVASSHATYTKLVEGRFGILDALQITSLAGLLSGAWYLQGRLKQEEHLVTQFSASSNRTAAGDDDTTGMHHC
jgi:hypothetical protein